MKKSIFEFTIKCTVLFFCFCIGIPELYGQSEIQIGEVKSMKRSDNIIYFSNTNADVQIEFCTDKIVRIRTSWDKDFKDRESLMVVNHEWPEVEVQHAENASNHSFKTSELVVQVNKAPFRIDIYDSENNLLLSEDVDSGSAGAFAYDNDGKGSRKKLFPDEHFFGFGERMDFLDRRGKKVKLDVGRGLGRPHIIGAYNVLEANYSPIPFFMSTKGYGIFFHTAFPTTWDMGLSSNDMYSFKADGGELDYYFIKGPQFPDILNGYTSITGKSPLLPKFALGLHVGTYSGGTWGHEEKTSSHYPVSLVKKFRDLNIPIDILHLDSTWRIFGENGGSGATTFEWRETFTKPEAMFDSLYDMNLNMVGLHVRPRFDNGKKLRLLDQAREEGFVYPEEDNPGEFVNFFDAEAVDWWWENGAMRVAEQGAMFFKTDEGSAFGRKANESEKTGPQGENIKSLHNLFPLVYTKAAFEKFQEYNGMRGMNHTREGYAGIQRYPFIWAGDWPSEWQYFEPVIKAGLNIGLSGVGYWSHNMGGFEHVADPELYIRWTQFGHLSPIAHLFGMEHPNYKEPWNYGEEAQEIFKKFARFRYSLIPYLYSHSYEMHKTGMPLMRALVLDYQDDHNVYNLTDQYMLGESIMVCPVTTKGAKTRVVYLPKGEWTNYWTGEVFTGEQYINVLCPLDEIPLFIKGGAIIPTQEVVDYIGEKEITNLVLDIYPSGKSEFDLYEDDGKSLEYQNGNFSRTKISVNDDSQRTTISIPPFKGRYEVPFRTYTMNIRLENMPRELLVNNQKYSLKEDGQVSGKTAVFKDDKLQLSSELNSNEDIKIEIIK